MPQQTISVGTVANDNTGDPFRTAFLKTNANFSELYGRLVSAQDFGAKGDTISFSDGAITSTAFSSGGAATFTNADVGKYILIHGAGAAGAALVTKIVAFVSAHAVTVQDAAASVVSGVWFSYGSDDTGAVQAAIAAGGTVDFSKGAYWLATLAGPISLANVRLRGIGQSQSMLPYTNQGSIFVLTAQSSLFSIASGVTIDGLGFYYPAQDGSSATPLSYPATLTGSAIFNFQFLNNYVINAYQLLQTTDAGGSAIGRAYFHNNKIYAVDTVLFLQGGAADEIAIDSTNYFGVGVFQDVGAVGNKYLANYTNTSGTIYKIDVGLAGKNSIDTLNLSGAFHYGYRYGIRIVSGLLDNSAIVGNHWDAIPTVLSVEGTARTDGITFSGNWVYSLQTFGSSPGASAFNTISYTSSANSGRVTISGNHFTFSQADFIYVNATALTSMDISGNTFAAWGQSTTTSTYYAIVLSDANLVANISANIFAAQAVSGSFQIGVDAVSKKLANLSGNIFTGCYYAVQDLSSAGITNLTGNMVNATASSNAVNNGVSGTATIYSFGNQWDKTPNARLGSLSLTADLTQLPA